MTSGGSTGSGMIGPAGDGYLINGAWHGYAWTAAVPATATTTAMASTIMPADFVGTAAGDPLCVMGSVGADPAYGGVGMLGVNLNQLAGKDPPINTITPTMKGIVVHVTNPGQASLRLQIQGPKGDTDATDRWCTPITGVGGFYPWTAFSTDCWSTTAPGAKYNNEPLVAAVITVPGSNATATPFSFCLKDIYEADSDTGSAAICNASDPPVTGSTTGQYGGHLVCGSDAKQYAIWSNRWGSAGGSQTISWSGASFSVDAVSGSADGNSGGVFSYPSIFIGSINSFATAQSNLPKQVSALTTVPTSWTWGAGAGEYNAAYDVWFNTADEKGLNAPTGGYLMVWLHKPGGHQPIGSQTGTATVGGKQWNVWTGTNGGTGKPCISYVAPSDLSTFAFDVNDFIKDAQKNHAGYMSNSWYLANVFAGFEIWSGGAGLKTSAFSAIVN